MTQTRLQPGSAHPLPRSLPTRTYYFACIPLALPLALSSPLALWPSSKLEEGPLANWKRTLWRIERGPSGKLELGPLVNWERARGLEGLE